MKYFKIEEFDWKGEWGYAPVKAEGRMNDAFLVAIDKCREIAGIPFKIDSGFRPNQYDIDKHQIANSDHALGVGCDVYAGDGTTIFTIVKAAMQIGFARIGVSKSSPHVHLGWYNVTKPLHVLWIE